MMHSRDPVANPGYVGYYIPGRIDYAATSKSAIFD